ncbi:MAG: extracellular solute-binding protein [Clostridia bacterium]|nr:extracellular solute-binding protein [Clostridia bacterium]
MKKRLSITASAAAMLTAAVFLTSCGPEKKAENNGGGQTLTYWVGMNSAVATKIQSFNDVEMYKQREKESGVHIEFTHPALGQESEQFNLMLASKKLPDIVEYSWANYVGGPQAAIDDGIIIALDDYIDKASNFKARLEEDSELGDLYRKGSTTDDGHYFGFTTLNTGEYRIFGGPCIRRDWLDELSLEVPETIDDWTNVLRAFKEKKGVAAPLTGSLSSFCGGAGSTFVGAFGVGDRLYQEDGKVKFGPMEDGYKKFLETAHMWYSEGLLDQDLSSNKSTLIDAKITNGESGAMICCYLGGGLGRYLKQKENEGASFDLVGTPYPVMNKGEINRFPIMEEDVMVTASAVVTSACKNPETAIEWLDYWYSEDGYNLMNFGVEGKSYNMTDGKPVYTDEILKNPEGLSIAEALSMYCRATSPAPGLKQAPEYLEQYYPYEQQKQTLEMWKANTSDGRKIKIANLNAKGDEADTLSSIRAELNTYVNEKVWNFVSGKESLDNYDAFRNELKSKFRIDEYLTIIQNQLDRYNNR